MSTRELPKELPKIRSATVYDKASARVRPDGSRIPDFDSEISRAKANADFRASHIKRAVKTLRKGQKWIASDVYEFEKVHKRRRVVVEETDDDDDDDDGGESSSAEPQETVIPSEKLGKSEPKRSHTKRRRLNIHDLSFLSNVTTSDHAAAAYGNLDPSSDLLKFIHHHASQFYTASGQLVNSERKYRLSHSAKSKEPESSEDNGTEEEHERSEEDDEESSEDSEEKVKVKEVRPKDDEGSSEGDHHEGSSSRSSGSDQDKGQGDDNSDGDHASDTNKKENTHTPSSFPLSQRKARIQRLNQKFIQKFREKRDMYKAFDGPVLFCIGMLVKAHVRSQLRARVPESWDDEVAAYQKFEELPASESDEGESMDETGVETDRNEKSPSEDSDDLRKKRKRRRKPKDDLRTNFVSADYSHL